MRRIGAEAPKSQGTLARHAWPTIASRVLVSLKPSDQISDVVAALP